MSSFLQFRNVTFYAGYLNGKISKKNEEGELSEPLGSSGEAHRQV
jgi:hypothetical protein